MRRRRLGPWGSSAVSISLGIAAVVACSVYDESLLTGGSEGKGGSASGGEGGEGATGGTGGSGATQGGGTGGIGKGGNAGSGGTDTGGTGTGGAAGSTGGTDQGGTGTGGDGGDPGTGGDAGSATGGNAGSTSGGNGGGGGAGPTGGSGGACGKCGCGMPETDTDTDGVPDCIDMCTGVSDADCAVLRAGLVHRYGFSGTGTAVMDSKGTAHGTALGTGVALSGSGTLVLAGGGTATADPKQYVDLPDDLLSGLSNATFEAWVTWGTTTTSWQRIFDFGTTATNSTGSYVFLTPRATSGGACRAAITPLGATGELATGGAQANGPVVASGMHHFVLAVDDTNDLVSLYVDGTLGTTVGFSGMLSAINDVNNWLGRSNYAVDPYFTGTFDEFRIYNVALTQAQLRTSRTAGPNATFF
jgi:hypothetical protein